jgi:hypothetical protein
VADLEKLNQRRIFEDLKLGEVMEVDISLLRPSQPNDYRTPLSKGPIAGCCEGEKILVVDGNHRYWEVADNTRDGESKLVSVKKVDSPYKI